MSILWILSDPIAAPTGAGISGRPPTFSCGGAAAVGGPPRLVPQSGPNVTRDPLARSTRPGLGGGPGHMGQAGPPLVLVGDLTVRGLTPGRGLGVLVHPLAASDPVVCVDPTDGDLLSLARIREQTSMVAMAKRWPGPMVPVLALLMAAVESDEDPASVAALLLLVEGAEGLVDGVDLRIKNLLVRA